MRFADLMADFFSRQPDERGYYPLSGAPPGSAAAALNIEELALFSVIDLISSVGAMCEWRFYNNRQRVELEDWYTWNFSPNPDQDGAEFKRLLLARMLRFNEALVFEQEGSYYIADSFSREQDGFRPAKYTGISYQGQSVTKVLAEQDVLHYRLAASGQAWALQNNIRGLYSSAMEEAWDKYRKSGGKSGILKVGAQARGDKRNFEKDFETLMNDRFKRFFESKNAVLPLFDGYDYIAQNGPAAQKSTSEVSDIGNLLQQAQVTACNPYHVPPSILRGEVTNLEDAVNAMLTFAVKPVFRTVEAEFNRKMFGRELMNGRRMQISTVGIKSVDILAQATNAEKLVQNRLYNANGVREIFGDEPIPESWADEYVLTKNVVTENSGEGSV